MIYRPPSEAYSYLLQVTVGCSHNKCTFCSMYKDKKFHVRPMAEILEDLSMAREYYDRVGRIFLCDGDALCLANSKLLTILSRIAELMRIDEIHVFDESGTIFSGTVPRYYGYSFDSGEQMAYFKPMLDDKTLSMCQDVTPNTAESKSMM